MDKIPQNDDEEGITPYNMECTESIDYSVLYRNQLNEMKKMGFYDSDANLRCLQRANGNVNMAVNILFGE